MNYPRYIVICKDDDGNYVFASHGWTDDRELAETYRKSVNAKRKAIVVTATQPLWETQP